MPVWGGDADSGPISVMAMTPAGRPEPAPGGSGRAVNRMWSMAAFWELWLLGAARREAIQSLVGGPCAGRCAGCP